MESRSAKGGLRIGQAAKLGEVSLQTIRYYEREGLLPQAPRLQSGYRVFSNQDVRRVRFIKRAQELGFSLKEIKELLSFQQSDGSGCAEVRYLARDRIAVIEQKIRSLQAMQKALSRLARACPGRGPVGNCPIIDSLNGDDDVR
ncbi:MAG: MerR family DNA-binding protein [Bryobacteraceae bacterium]